MAAHLRRLFAVPVLVLSLAAARGLAAEDELRSKARSGDAAAQSAWKKLGEHTEKECERIVAEAGELNGKTKAAAPAGDLAAELEAAILGNFARREAEARKPRRTVEELRKEFMALGALPADRLEEALRALDKP